MASISSPAPTPAAVPPGTSKPRGKRVADGLYPYSYIAPSIAFMVIASFFPIAFTLYIAFTNYGYTPGNAAGHFVNFNVIGWSNFQAIFTTFDPVGFFQVFVWTIVFAASATLLSFAGGLFLAYLLNNENMWERNIYRTVLVIPWALPGAIAILAWSGILNTDGGFINSILVQLHVQPIPFLQDNNWARFWVVAVSFWLGYPFMMTACLGALQSISPEVLQAAEIDGATALQKFFRVTFPLLRTAALPLVIATFAYNMNNFGVVYLLTGGGPTVAINHGATDILPTFVYNLANNQKYFGLACAYGVLIFFIIGTLSAVNMKLSGAFEQVD